MSKSKLATALTWFGLVPFVALSIAAVLPIADSLRGLCLFFYLSYATIILSFLGGIHWGVALQDGYQGTGLIISSNIASLLAWVCLLLPFPMMTMALLAIGFVMQLVIDRRLVQQTMIPSWFYAFRPWVTGMVIVTLGLATWGLLM